MKIIIRADASFQIGSGHVMRCLTIAKKLVQVGCHVKFWMNSLEGNLISLVKKEGFENCVEPEFADLYIVDHYEIDYEWECMIYNFTKKLMVIDDLVRKHNCDLLLDQNVVPKYETRYDECVPQQCIKLLGPKYLILRDEFIQERQQLRERNNEIKRLLIFMGGSDPTNETVKILSALEYITFDYIDVVVGNSNPEKNIIEQICKKRNYHYHCQIDYIAQLMQQADFAIGAGGATMWERCYLGLPSSATIVADNQRIMTNFAEQLGVVKNLGWHEQVTVNIYKKLLLELSIEGMSEKALQLTENHKPNAWLNEILELKL